MHNQENSTGALSVTHLADRVPPPPLPPRWKSGAELLALTPAASVSLELPLPAREPVDGPRYICPDLNASSCGGATHAAMTTCVSICFGEKQKQICKTKQKKGKVTSLA